MCTLPAQAQDITAPVEGVKSVLQIKRDKMIDLYNTCKHRLECL